MGDGRDRDDRGRFEQEHGDEVVLEAVEKHEPAGTTEVASELGIARQSADYRLHRLEEAGHVSKKKVGGALIWTVNRDGK